MGRHGSSHIARLVATVAVSVTLAAATVIALVGRDRLGVSSGPGPDDASTCPSSVRVLTASSFAPVLAHLATGLAVGDDCVRLEVGTADGREAPERVEKGGIDVWIPDDAAWAGTAEDGLLARPGLGRSGTVLATSPIFMVTDPPTAGRVRQAGGSWAGLVDLLTGGSGVRVAVRDPAGSGDGMVAAGDLGESVWLKKGMDASAVSMAAVLKAARTVTGGAAALPSRPGEVGLVPEYALVSALATRQRLADHAAVLTGTDHSGLLRFTWLPTAQAAGTADRAAALSRLFSALTGPRAAAALDSAHLRPPDGASPPSGAGDRFPRPSAPPFGVLRPHHVHHVFAAWYRDDRRTDLLVVVDVSGSMAAPAPGSRTPLIDLVREGCRSIGSLLPDDARLGLWAFGSRLRPPRDYQVLLPTGPLAGARRQALSKAIAALAAKPTGTGLYDTILAAYKTAQSTHRPGVADQVLVFTDGRNEDDPGSVTAQRLRAQLAAAKDPKRPVGLSVVAFGARPEAAVLKKILEPVDGYLDPVVTAEQVAAAFVHVAAGGLDEHLNESY